MEQRQEEGGGEGKEGVKEGRTRPQGEEWRREGGVEEMRRGGEDFLI